MRQQKPLVGGPWDEIETRASVEYIALPLDSNLNRRDLKQPRAYESAASARIHRPLPSTGRLLYSCAASGHRPTCCILPTVNWSL